MAWLIATPAMASFSGYTYERVITVNHLQVSSGTLTYTNFPVLFQDTDVTLSTSAAGGHLSNPNAYDLGFYSDPSCAQSFLLNWDTETINNTGSMQTNIWVEIPVISSSTDTTFYACYGNSSVSSYQSFSTATWDSNYLGVYHLGTSTSSVGGFYPVNSTSAQDVGISSGVSSSSGKIDGAALFVGADSSTIELANVSVSTIQVPITISLWYFANTIDTHNGSFMYADDNGFSYSRKGLLNPDLFIGLTQSGGLFQNFMYSSAGNPSSTGVWHYLTEITSGTLSSPFLSIILDGNAPQTYTPNPLDPSAIIGTFSIGINFNTGGFDGIIDEFRFSNTARSADLAITEYRNQNSPGTFLTIGPESGGSPPNTHGISIKGSKVRIGGGKVRAL